MNELPADHRAPRGRDGGKCVRRCRFVVTGRVQGVGFRAATRAQAEQLGLVGFVGNRADGAVAGEAQGEGPELATLRAWLASGPRLARVIGVEWSEVAPVDGDAGFRIVR